ncbi:MAG: sulfotransferase [Gammaproteobacteria bacterium]
MASCDPMSSPPVGTLQVALAHAAGLLASNPAAAAEQASEILRVFPGHPAAELLMASAQRRLGNVGQAVASLTSLARQQPNWPAAQFELGFALGAAGQGDAAVVALRHALKLNPEMPDAWRALADHLTVCGDTAAADAAYAQQIRYSSKDPRLVQAAIALHDNDIPRAEALLRQHLKQHPTDVAAIRMFAEVAARLERYADAQNLLERCLELAPGFAAARRNYATVLHRQYKDEQALEQVDRLLALDAEDPTYRNLKAAILGALGRYDESIELYASILARHSGQEKVWLNYGHALKTAGRQQDSIDAYRKCIALAPHSGAAYWSLANLKTFRFSQDDVEAMRTQLARTDLGEDERVQFHFALGKALEDAKAYEGSFEQYARGNSLRRAQVGYDADRTSARTRRCREILTADFFEQRRGFGSEAPDPIFIVGLPRAGSTLLEQILASHSAVEGTMELPDLISLARKLPGTSAGGTRFPESLTNLSAAEARALGEQYLQQTRIQRKTAAPFFIDKMPNNFAYVGFIQLVLPNAKIIDARRHPLGCCLSVFKQHFARGQGFAYDLDDLGRYYRDYVALMAHFDRALPGRVHRVIYETMVQDTESEVRRLLDYCGLPFEESCLRFYENARAVRTASSEQVRQPIFRDALEHWRSFEPWLGPLKSALGPTLDAYPTPQF